MAGKREVAENYFVEPSTGRCYPCNGSPYEGVEFIWNHTNFWVNMQPPKAYGFKSSVTLKTGRGVVP
eukprot:9489728-Pyramimonas_sp.AAC.1